MPIYEYRCRDCGESLEVRQAFTDGALTECPNCSGSLRKLFSTPGISFKGSGFYKTDSRSGGSGSSSSAPSTAKTGADGVLLRLQTLLRLRQAEQLGILLDLVRIQEVRLKAHRVRGEIHRRCIVARRLNNAAGVTDCRYGKTQAASHPARLQSPALTAR